MFDMFNGGNPDPMTLMAVDYEERQELLYELVDRIRNELEFYSGYEPFDIDPIVEELGLDGLSPEEYKWIESRVYGN
jgi:hypothetical protein